MTANSSSLHLRDTPAPEALLPSHGLWPWWLAAALAAAIIITFSWFIIKRRNRAPDSQAARNEAYHEASTALARVHSQDAREAAVHGSLILRRYLSLAAADPALFETHEEFISRHDALQPLSPAAREAANEGFTRLAALKYGPQAPATPAADVIAESRRLLETLHRGSAT